MILDRITITDGAYAITADRQPTGWPRMAFTSSSGVDDGWGVDSTKVQRAGGLGATVSGWQRPGRELTIAGAWQGADPAEARRVIDTVRAIGASGRCVTLTRQTSLGLRSIDAVLDGEPDMTAHLDDRSAVVEWKLPFYASDPVWHAPPVEAQARTAGQDAGLVWPLFAPDGLLDWGADAAQEASIANPGTIDAWPTVTVQGLLPSGFALADAATGRRVVYRGAVTPMAPVTIDFAAGTATTPGGGSTELITARDWWTVPAAGTARPTLMSVQPGGSGVATITIRPAWA